MASETRRDISEILSANPSVILEAVSEGVQDAIERHKQMGLPMAIWEDGAVRWVAPAKLERARTTVEGGSAPVQSATPNT